MLKFLFFIIFLIPLCLLKNNWWLVQNMFFMISFFFFFNISYFYCWGSLSYFFGCDYMSFGLILLSFWICSLMIMASESIYFFNYFSCFFMFIIIMLMIMLYCTFSSLNLFSFYFFFESSLVPTLFLILGWGYQPERLQSGIYLLFYTLLASLPLLGNIMYLYMYIGSLDFFLIDLFDFNLYMYVGMIMAFLVKVPMFFVHLWLPKAHVEAPISGSMILAGILLKMGGYGLLRVLYFLFNYGVKYNYILMSVSLVGGVLVSLICLCQTDLKSLIAYSSVAHMSMVIVGLMTMFYWGFYSSYILMLGHGLCSSGLFCLANITYERLGSRSLLINKGLLNFMPSMSMWWFLLCSCNMSSPPSLNLLGEIGLLFSMVSFSFYFIIFFMFLSFFSASYTLYMYSCSQHGKLFSSIYSCSSGYSREYLLLFLHWFPLNFMILFSMLLLWL